MALTWTSISGNFNDTLYNDLLKVEAPTATVRLTGLMVKGNFTIGIGFDLIKGGLPVQRAVFTGLGLKADFLTAARPIVGLSAQTEYDFVRELLAAINAHNSGTDLNAIMARRAAAAQADPAYATYLGSTPRSTFSFVNEAEVRQAFDALWEPVYRESIFAKWPETRSDTGFASSQELIALASMTWNGGAGILGNKLRAAIQAGNRAEAWFEIRYGSNGGDSESEGLAKRRYVESQLFGPYNNAASVTAAESKQVFAMLTKHRASIFAYEAKYGIPADGTSATRNMITEALLDANLASIAKPQSLFDALIPARDAFIAWLNTQLPVERQIDASILNPAAIYYNGNTTPGVIGRLDASSDDGKGTALEHNVMVGNGGADILIGGAGDDVLVGQAGSDVLEGGAGVDELFGGTDNDILNGSMGDDILYGGGGEDLYIWNTGDGNDTIVDDDGGRLIVNGVGYGFGGGTMTKVEGQNVWEDPTGNVKLTHNSPWRIELSDGSVIQLGEGFDPAKWHINLVEEGALKIYTGEQRAKLIGIEIDTNILPGDPLYNTYKWGATSWAADGTLTGGVAQANFAPTGAIDFVATYASQSGVAARFDYENPALKLANLCVRRQFDRSNAKTAHARSMRLARHKGLGRRMDAAWGSLGTRPGC